jgi:hypothetical protein
MRGVDCVVHGYDPVHPTENQATKETTRALDDIRAA